MDLSGTSSTSAADASGNAITSSTSVPCRDQVYCLELAKRSVARAALHLGITSMTAEVLDTLGDVLCEHLQRLGGVLAHNVESSGRSTQHCNALDMIRAIEICTSPAVNRVHFTGSGTTAANGNGAAANNSAAAAMNSTNTAADGFHTANVNSQGENGNSEMDNRNGENNNNNSHNNAHPPGAFQGLAAFCFGPNWQDQKEKELEVAELQGAGGKVGPQAVSQEEEAKKDCQEGWRAPYPDEVAPFPLCSPRVANPHGMSKKGQLMNLYGRLAPPTDNPTEIMRGQDLISAEAADMERQEMERTLGRLPGSAWGGLTPTPTASSAASAAATTANGSGPGTTGVTTDGKDGTGTANNGAGSKRKLEEEDAAIKKEDAKSDDAAGATTGDKKAESTTDDKTNSNNDKDDKASAQPAKKKVKLDDGSAKTTKASTPKKKKAGTKDTDKDDEEMQDAEPDARGESNKPEDAEAASPGQNAIGRKTYNYVPTFFPPIPNMSAGADAASLRKTTVVDILDAKPSSAPASRNATSVVDSATTTTFGLRSALVDLGTSYWGSQADDDESTTAAAAAEGADSSKVPAGRGDAATEPPQGPIVPLGRASGSRVSRILEGSMDAATMQQ